MLKTFSVSMNYFQLKICWNRLKLKKELNEINITIIYKKFSCQFENIKSKLCFFIIEILLE
jgi:hypothetical protein